MTEALRELGNAIKAALPSEIEEVDVRLGELMLVAKGASIVRVMTHLRDDPGCLFKMLIDVCGVDYPERERRFDVVYNLLSLKHNRRIRVKVRTDETTPVPSISQVFNAANWYERETWDIYGVAFSEQIGRAHV